MVSFDVSLVHQAIYLACHNAREPLLDPYPLLVMAYLNSVMVEIRVAPALRLAHDDGNSLIPIVAYRNIAGQLPDSNWSVDCFVDHSVDFDRWSCRCFVQAKTVVADWTVDHFVAGPRMMIVVDGGNLPTDQSIY